MATPDQTIRALDSLLESALNAAGRQATTEANKWIPIDEGDLRRSEQIGDFRRTTDGASIKISWNVDYARKQYFASLRHFMPGGFPAPVTSYERPPGKAGSRNQYQRSYRKALKDGVMRRVAGGLMWLDRAIKNGRARKNINRVFLNFYK